MGSELTVSPGLASGAGWEPDMQMQADAQIRCQLVAQTPGPFIRPRLLVDLLFNLDEAKAVHLCATGTSSVSNPISLCLSSVCVAGNPVSKI